MNGRLRPGTIVLLASLLLPACGFSLRGSERLTGGLPVLALNLQQPAGELAVLLQRRLLSAGVELVATSAADTGATPVLSVAAEQLVTRPVTVNPRARAAQYEVLLSVTVSVADSDREILAPVTLTVEKLFFENIETISGNLEEMQVIQAEMRRELIDQIMRRLEAAGSNSIGA